MEFFDTATLELRVGFKSIKKDIAYQSDLFTQLNKANKQLQEDGVKLIQLKSTISAFQAKVVMYKRNIEHTEFFQFPFLSNFEKDRKVANKDLLVCKQNCVKIWNINFMICLLFKFLTAQSTPSLKKRVESGELEEELITLQKDIELKPKFYKYYQELWKKVKLFSLAFPTSYLVEREFSEVTHLLTKQLCKLRITDCGDLKLILSTTEPKIERLLPLHHAHLSH